MYLEMLYGRFNNTEDNSLMTKSAVANKFFRHLAKNYISPVSSRLTKMVPGGIRYSDLTIPLKERVSGKFANGYLESLSDSYSKYLSSVWRKDPGIARFNTINEKIDRVKNLIYRLDTRPHVIDAERLIEDIAFNGYAPFGRAAETQALAIPRLTVYKAKTPYATTHHLADGKASLAANKAAQKAKPGALLLKNPNPDAGWKNYRGQEFRVNTPGAPWSPEELELMRTSSNLSNTNLYETVFSHADRNFPNAIATYVPDTQEIRQALSLKPDIKGVPIDELQSKVQGILYKGTRASDLAAKNASKAYKNAVRHYVPDKLKNKLGTIFSDQSIDGSIAPERWFAPASRTSMGYAGGRDSQKFIRLDSNALRRLRESRPAEFPSKIPELEAYTDADWANMFRVRHQQDRVNRIIKQIETQRENAMPEGLYHLAKGHRYVNA